jgi:hypothetical protein
LITLLATKRRRCRNGAVTRIGVAVGIGTLGALALLLAVYGAIHRCTVTFAAAFWVKIVFAASLLGLELSRWHA